jgi:glutamate dehydrogenase
VEPFSNNMVIFAFLIRTLSRVHGKQGELPRVTSDMSSRLAHIAEDASLHFILPRHSLTPLLRNNVLSAQQLAYAYCAWKFTFHFLNRGQQEQTMLASLLQKVSTDAYSLLSRLRQSIQMHGYNEGAILEVIYRNPELVEWLYEDFAKRHMPNKMHRRSRVFSCQPEDFGGEGGDTLDAQC